jgi:putative transposase
MTAPRQILPNVTYLVTRRCFQRHFLLKPSKSTNAILLFVLAVAVERFDMELHAFCVLSNHLHLVLTDPEGRLPEFERYFDSLVARAINAFLGRWESFWAPSSYSAVTLVSPQDVVDKAAYVLANPVAAGLVKHGREWPGLWSSPEMIENGALEVSRPGVFFRPEGSMPRKAALSLTSPPGFESAAAFRKQLSYALAVREEQAAVELSEQGKGFLGVRRVIAQDPLGRPRPGEPRRGLSPRVACRDKWRRIEVLARLKNFVRAYRQAWLALKAGVRDVIFPEGTYWLRVTLGARCAGSG